MMMIAAGVKRLSGVDEEDERDAGQYTICKMGCSGVVMMTAEACNSEDTRGRMRV